jgi:tetratricopeptide (TPR) repeat protein
MSHQFADATQPDNAKAYTLRGAAYQQMNQPQAAVIDYSEAIKRQPNAVSVLLARGAAYAEMQQYDASLADREKAVELAPKSAEVYIARGGSQRSSGSTFSLRKTAGRPRRPRGLGLSQSAYARLGLFDGSHQ